MVRINKMHLFLILLPLTTHNKQKRIERNPITVKICLCMYWAFTTCRCYACTCMRVHTHCTQASLTSLQRWRNCGTAYNLTKGSKKFHVNSKPILFITKYIVPQEKFHYPDSQNCYKNLKSKCRRYFSSKGVFLKLLPHTQKDIKIKKEGRTSLY